MKKGVCVPSVSCLRANERELQSPTALVDLADASHVAADLETGSGAYAERFCADGLLGIDGFTDIDTIRSFVESIMEPHIGRDEDEYGLTFIASRTNPPSWGSYQAFSNGHLFPHTDGSGLEHPPLVVFLCSLQGADSGGGTLLTDCRSIWQRLSWTAPSELECLQDTRAVAFGGDLYPAAIFEVCHTRSGTRIASRFRHDSDSYWRAELDSARQALLEAISVETKLIQLLPGQAVLIQNNRWLHGRTSFLGRERLFVRARGAIRSSAINDQLSAGFLIT